MTTALEQAAKLNADAFKRLHNLYDSERNAFEQGFLDGAFFRDSQLLTIIAELQKALEQLQKEKEHIRQHLLAQTKISNELLDEKEKLNQALKVAEKALRYMTEDYDCDPADVADFDKRRADQALEEIKKIMGEG